MKTPWAEYNKQAKEDVESWKEEADCLETVGPKEQHGSESSGFSIGKRGQIHNRSWGREGRVGNYCQAEMECKSPLCSEERKMGKKVKCQVSCQWLHLPPHPKMQPGSNP